ncbi:fasciclin domain-containing protein [Maribacter chungangensis]|uniref:Fasciclin domain-containing protein n=1 Tax=Maribacter chungangensis TaxID=1069117 RepID=A0ABW3B2K2_9FLAO
MKKWSFPAVSLCMLLSSLVSTAQEPVKNTILPLVSTYVMDADKSILNHAETSNRLSSLSNALRASDLDKVLEYNGQFTVFAPSDMAFEKLSDLTTERLLDPQNKKELKSILSCHIVAAKLSASSILRSMSRGGGKASFTTIQGQKITATMNGIDIILTDKNGNKAKIVLADVNQSNGVIHEVDSVFLPVASL